MTTRLISYSRVPDGSELDLNNVQELIAYCARVSNPSNQMNKATSERLIKYLIKHAHCVRCDIWRLRKFLEAQGVRIVAPDDEDSKRLY